MNNENVAWIRNDSRSELTHSAHTHTHSLSSPPPPQWFFSALTQRRWRFSSLFPSSTPAVAASSTHSPRPTNTMWVCCIDLQKSTRGGKDYAKKMFVLKPNIFMLQKCLSFYASKILSPLSRLIGSVKVTFAIRHFRNAYYEWCFPHSMHFTRSAQNTFN